MVLSKFHPIRRRTSLGRRLVGLACAFLPLVAPAAVRILGVEPTVLFSNETPVRQVAWLQLENSSNDTLTLDAAVAVNGTPSGASQRLSVAPGVSKQELLIPDLTAEATVEITLLGNGQRLAAQSRPWLPQRKWKVFVVKSSHEDIGYENFLFIKQKQIADYIDLGRHISGAPDAPPDAPKQTPPSYHYYLESLLFPRYYIEERSEQEWRKIVEHYILPGSMGLGAAPSGIHTHWMDYEELVRTTYLGRREYKDRFGLDLDTYLIVDNPSMSWSTAQVLAGAGYKYAVRFGAPFRAGGNNDYASTQLPAVFWWKAPDQKSRVLYTWRNRYSNNFWFGEAVASYSPLLDLAAINVNREVMSVQNGTLLGPYPYDAMLVPSYRDHTTPAWDITAFRNWRAKYRYPEIRIADPRDFMVYMDKKYAAEIPELSGDLNNFSADYATIDPAGQGWKRRASRLLPLAEGINVIARTLDPGSAPQGAAVATAYQRMFDFDEHSWPTTPPPGEFHQFNAQWGKHLEGKRALEDAERIYAAAMHSFTAHIQTGDTPLLVVFNPLAHRRSDLVTALGEFDHVIDEATGQRLPAQPLKDGTSVFIAPEIPGFGYRGFRPGRTGKPNPENAELRAGPDLIANAHYTLKFNRDTGVVVSIRDQELDRELVDPKAPYGFNQLVWVDKVSGQSLEGTNYSPVGGARLETTLGPVFTEMKVTLQEPRLGDATIVQTVRLYAGSKRIDVINDLRHVGALNTPFNHRYRKNVFFAFPIAVENFVPRVEYSGGVVRPFDDQLRWGSHDFLYANRWVDVSNASHGFTMAPWNAATVHFGEIRYNQLSVNYKPERSHLYSFAWSNRMAGLKELAPSDWNTRVGYSFASHRGDWNTGATTKLGWSVASPLEAKLVPAKQAGKLPATRASMLSLDAENVHLVVLKESEQPGRGWIVRLVETEGRDTEATLNVSWLNVTSATLCDLVENDREDLAVNDGRVRVRLGAHSYATVRLHAREQAPAAVAGLAATPLSDSAIQLDWKHERGADAYNIYRSSDPDAPATMHTLIGRTGSPPFIDRGLNIDTAYYYRVAPVTARNNQGGLSSVSGRTTRRNTSPPLPVRELDIVRLAKDSLMVCWRKAPESDIARYLVFRSDSISRAATDPVAEVTPTGYQLEYWKDQGLTAGRTYHYQVLAEDWAGNRQTVSPTASATTPHP